MPAPVFLATPANTKVCRTGSRLIALLLVALCPACTPDQPPPRFQQFEGFPISGSLADAHHAGFTDCFNYTAVDVRCRKHKVTVRGLGPFEAAVDLAHGDGSGGFDHLTLWSDADQEAVYPVTDLLEHNGWRQCMTGTEQRGDQLIYTYPGKRAWVAMDLSYWGKRRLRFLPEWNQRERTCKPGTKRVSQALR